MILLCSILGVLLLVIIATGGNVDSATKETAENCNAIKSSAEACRKGMNHINRSNLLMSIAIAGLIESLMSDLANNPPEGSTPEEMVRHREAAMKAHESRERLMGLSEKGGDR